LGSIQIIDFTLKGIPAHETGVMIQKLNSKAGFGLEGGEASGSVFMAGRA